MISKRELAALATLFERRALDTRSAGFAKRISTHLALALVAFCVLQIVIVAKIGGSLILHLCIIIAIGGFAFAARGLEHRWAILDQSELSQSGLGARFRRDVLQIWCASLFGAMMWIPVAVIFRALFG